MAKQKGVAGWHSMRKEELVKAIVKVEKAKTRQNGKSKATRTKVVAKANGKSNGTKTKNGAKAKTRPTAIQRKIQRAHADREKKMDLTTPNGSGKANGQSGKDRVVLMVRDSYWLHVNWQLSPSVVQRARAALSQDWHTAKPIIRLHEIDNSSVSDATEKIVREIEIHGAVENWYIDVANPPSSYRVEIGYITSDRRFLCLGRSNSVTTPVPGSADMIDTNWAAVAQDSEKIYAMSGGYDNQNAGGELQELFEERLRRPMGSPMVTRFGDGAEGVLKRKRGMSFNVDAEMIVYGVAEKDAFVTLAGEPVKLAPDGSFTARVSLPDRRRVLPVVASSSDGVEERTIVLAVERNTKVMEPVRREPGE